MKTAKRPNQRLGFTLVDVMFLIICVVIIIAAIQLARLHQARQAASRLTVSANNTSLISQLNAIAERAYFDGQREALNGDVRITWDTKSQTWSWAKSPWDEGIKPTFDPTHEPAPKNPIQAEKP